MFLLRANMRQSIFPHMALNMLASCCQRVTRYLLHQTLEVLRAYATRPAKQQQMANILDPRTIVMHTSESPLSDSCFSASVQLLCNQARIREATWRLGWRERWQEKLSYRCDVIDMWQCISEDWILWLNHWFIKKETRPIVIQNAITKNQLINFCFSVDGIYNCFWLNCYREATRYWEYFQFVAIATRAQCLIWFHATAAVMGLGLLSDDFAHSQWQLFTFLTLLSQLVFRLSLSRYFMRLCFETAKPLTLRSLFIIKDGCLDE